MRKSWLLIFVALTGCATFGDDLGDAVKWYWLLREQYAQGVVVYRTAPGDPNIESVIFNMTNPGQVDLTVKYRNFSLVYGLAFKYASGAVSSETKEAKLMYRWTDFTFLSANEIRVVVPPEIADELVAQDKLVMTVIEKSGRE